MTTNPKKIGQLEFICLMAMLIAIVSLSIDAMLPGLPQIGRDLGTKNPNQTTLILTFIFAGMAVGYLFIGPLSDAIGRKKALYFSFAIYIVGSIICMLSPSLTIMLLGRVIQGFGAAGPFISTVAIVRDNNSGAAMARIMSLIMGIFILVPAIAPAVGQAILAIAPWRAIFGFFAIYAMIVVSWAAYRLEESLPVERRREFKLSNLISGAKEVYSHNVTISYTVAAALVFGCLFLHLSTVQQVYVDKYGVGNLFPLFFGLTALGSAISSLTNSRIVGRFGMRKLALTALITISSASASFFVLSSFFELGLFWYLGAGVIIFFCIGMVFGNLNTVAMEPMGHLAGLASAVISTTTSVIGNIVGTTFAQLYDGRLASIFIVFASLSSIALVIVLNTKVEKYVRQPVNRAETVSAH